MSALSPQDTLAEERLGQTFHGKYRLEKLLGVGGMAAVYAAVHRNGHRVAVKVLHRELAVDPEIRSRFLQEGYAANRVGHPGSVRVIDDDVTDSGTAFLVMELLSGRSVDQFAETCGGKLPVREACAIGHALLEVLAAAHAQGIVHRDIKPDNLFLTSEGELKILDFGIARLKDPSLNVAITRTGQTSGTPAFMPPEQALGRSREIDERTDIFAVGATLFTLLSGRYVHDATNQNEMVVYAATRPARKVSDVVSVPTEVATVVDTALRFHAKDRYPNAESMRAALAVAYHACFGGSPTDVRFSIPSEPSPHPCSARSEGTLRAQVRRNEPSKTPTKSRRMAILIATSAVGILGGASLARYADTGTAERGATALALAPASLPVAPPPPIQPTQDPQRPAARPTPTSPPQAHTARAPASRAATDPRSLAEPSKPPPKRDPDREFDVR